MSEAFSNHELLDRTSTIADMVGSLLLEHHAFVELPKSTQEKINQAASNLADAYQEIGKICFKEMDGNA